MERDEAWWFVDHEIEDFGLDFLDFFMDSMLTWIFDLEVFCSGIFNFQEQ